MDRQLLEILACPLCQGKLSYEQAHNELVCKFHNLAYPIQKGVPVLLREQARKLKTDKAEFIRKDEMRGENE